jgi:hypothetical protein
MHLEHWWNDNKGKIRVAGERPVIIIIFIIVIVGIIIKTNSLAS